MENRNGIGSMIGPALRVLAELMSLNLLWIVCSLPVVTIGPASTALCAVMLKVAQGEPVMTLKTFFEAFKRNFVQSLLLGLLGLAGLAVAAIDWFFTSVQTGGLRILYSIVSVFVTAAVLSGWAWAFALQARFENSLGGTIGNALKLAFVEPGRTLVIWLAFAAVIASAVFLPFDLVLRLAAVYALVCVSAPAYVAARIQNRVFDRFSGRPEERGSEEDQ